MKRLSGRTFDEIIEYNLRGDGNEFTIFADSQPARVEKARELVAALLPPAPATIIELGCSAGDISGWFSNEHNVMGVDVVPGAIRAAEERYPHLFARLDVVEEIDPVPCDVLILCEFLEHIVDPTGLVTKWGPLAAAMVVGHPLFEDPQIEPGHLWSYDTDDFDDWFRLAGMTVTEAFTFDMGPFPRMIIGAGKR